MSLPRINYGPCPVCGKPIVYLGARHCGPKCWIASGTIVHIEPVPEPEPEPFPESEPESVPESEPVPEPPAVPMIGLEPPPDEPPVRRRLYL